MTEIAIILPSLRGGGAERVMTDIAGGLHALGADCDLVVATGADAAYSRDLSPGIQLVDLGAATGLRSLRGLFEYVGYLRRRRPLASIISGHSMFLLALLASPFHRTRRIIVVHNTVSRESRWSRLIPRWLYRFADEVVAVSQGVAEDVARYGRIHDERITVIHNALDLPRIDKCLSQPTTHPWLQASECPVILGVGRLHPQKRFDLLISAFAELRHQIEVRLIILGEGELREPLDRQARELGVAEDVQLLGFSDNPYIFMRDAAVFALSSDFEGFGMVLLEALACRCPVVSTDCPSGPREILDNGKWGQLVASGNTTELAAALRRTLEEGPSRNHLRRRAEEFSVDVAARRYLTLVGRVPSGTLEPR